jgi:glycosyltransferase involved in cell wall biosynthesis
MRILFLAGSIFRIGGIERFNRNLLDALTKLGLNLYVFSINDRKLKTSLPYTFKGCGNRYRLISKIKFLLFSIFYSLKFRPNLVICGHINFSPLCYVLKRLFDLDYMVITYGIDAVNIKSRLKRLALKETQLILSISDFTKKKIIEQIPELNGKIYILPPAVDNNEFHPKKRKAELVNKYGLNGKKVILTVARLSLSEKCKGYDKVIMAMKDVVKEIPDVKYLIGGSGDDVDRIKGLIKDNGLMDKVILTGFVPNEDIVDYYNLCDVFVMPSKQEGFGIVFLEALACGKPVIAGNKDGSKEPLLDGELGILVDPDNMDEISHAIIKVLKKEVPKRLLDSRYLRKTVLEVYGFYRFRERVNMFIETS